VWCTHFAAGKICKVNPSVDNTEQLPTVGSSVLEYSNIVTRFKFLLEYGNITAFCCPVLGGGGRRGGIVMG